MSDIGLAGLDALVHGAAIALLVLLAGTPLLWSLARGLARPRRAVLTSLACLGASGLLSLPFSLDDRTEGTAAAALLASAILQGAALIVLLLLPSRT